MPSDLQAHCERLSVMSGFKDAMELLEVEEPEEFTRCLADSGLRWLALASVNQKAHEAMHAVNGSIDRVMTNLPDAAQAQNLLRQQLDKLGNLLQQDAREIEMIAN